MFRKILKNNKAGGDVQFGLITFMFIFIVSVALIFDFWFVSSAKISIIKEVQSAELFRLVTSVKDGGGLDNPIFHDLDPYKVDLSSFQRTAVNGMRNELTERLDRMPYVNDYNIITIQGLSQPIGEMGIYTHMTYRIKAMIRSPGQIFNFMKKDEEIDIASINNISLKVTTKLVPYVHEN